MSFAKKLVARINAQVEAGHLKIGPGLTMQQLHTGPIATLRTNGGGGGGDGSGGGSGGNTGVTWKREWYGDQLSLNQTVTQEVIAGMAEATATASIVAAVLGPAFPTGAVVAGVVAGVLGLGEGALQAADAAGHGIYIDFFADLVPFWVGSQ
jgi:hypothetical protein